MAPQKFVFLLFDRPRTPLADAEKKKIQKLLDSQHAEMAKFMEQAR